MDILFHLYLRKKKAFQLYSAKGLVSGIFIILGMNFIRLKFLNTPLILSKKIV
jgi:hypothetical protein